MIDEEPDARKQQKSPNHCFWNSSFCIFSNTNTRSITAVRLASNHYHPTIHLFFHFHPNFPLPGHFLQVLQDDFKAFQGLLSDAITPVHPGCYPESPLGRTCPRHLPREAARGHLIRPSHLSWLLSMQRSNGFALSTSGVREQLPLSP